MLKVLITGPSGSGQTTIGRGLDHLFAQTPELAHFVAIDTDTDCHLGIWKNIKTNELEEWPGRADWEWLQSHVYEWDKHKLAKLFEVHRNAAAMIICGNSSNVLDLSSLFDKRFYLHVNDEIVKERVVSRSSHYSDPLAGFGRNEAEFQTLMDFKKKLDSQVKNYDFIEFDNNGTADKTIELIYRAIQEAVETPEGVLAL